LAARTLVLRTNARCKTAPGFSGAVFASVNYERFM
jgi:hypothetical protein